MYHYPWHLAIRLASHIENCQSEKAHNDLEAMLKLTKGVDIVYHTAAFAYEGLSVFSPNIVSKNVYQNTVSLLSAAIQNRVKSTKNMDSQFT